MRKLAFLFLVAGAAACAQAQLLYATGFEASEGYSESASAIGVDGWVAGTNGGTAQVVSQTEASTGVFSLRWDSGAGGVSYSIARTLPSFSGQLDVTIDLFFFGAGANRTFSLLLTSPGPGVMSDTVFGLSFAGNGKFRAGTSWADTRGASSLFTAASGFYDNRWLTLALHFELGTGGSYAAIHGMGGAITDYQTDGFMTNTLPQGLNIGIDVTGATNNVGTGFMDTLVVGASVPEPTTLCALSLGAIALIRRRRK